MTSLLSQVQGATYVSSIDLTAAYMAVKLTKRAQQLAALQTTAGTFVTKRLVFGLKNAVSFFTSLMRRILAGLTDVFSYLDDILIITKLRPN